MKETLAKLLFWRKPDDRLKEFAETEAFGARDLARAAEQVSDPWLRRQLIRHAQDEVRHAVLLEEQMTADAAESGGLGAAVAGETNQDAGIDITEMGEVEFVAFVHEAEKRAVEEFKLHQGALGDKGEFFESILQDEKRHVAWTGHQLDKWREAGRGDEVDKAMRGFFWGRIYQTWMWLARRISWVMSTIILTVLYLTVVAPFSFMAGRFEAGWRDGRRLDLERQF
ncbi:MAG: ferritin-like domain-containing protein [Proteobacteria bacterium]|nr:ferritin-like domain-containing protein [Pseudomonadota bacterium]MCP4920331.1 ferritin-like domain-containing protein [Pseudomonadota bacterium]